MYKLVRDGLDYYLVKPDTEGDETIIASTVPEHFKEHGIGRMTIDDIEKAWLSYGLAQMKASQAYPPEENDQLQAVKQVLSRKAYALGYRAALKDILTDYEWAVEAELKNSDYFQIKNFI
jgi:hypothetical protein